MKVVWQDNKADKKQAKKRVTLYWLYKCGGQKRRYICSFLSKGEAIATAKYMSDAYSAWYAVEQREERPQICP